MQLHLSPLPVGESSAVEARRLISPIVDPDLTWGIHMSLDDGGPIATVSRWVEHTILVETYGIDPEELADGCVGFDPASVWQLLVHHPTGSPVGVVRYVVGDPRGFEFTQVLHKRWGIEWEEACAMVGVDPEAQYVEGNAFAALPEWRSADRLWPIKMMAVASVHIVEDLGAVASVQLINPLVRRAFNRYGFPFLSVGEPLDMGAGWGRALWDPCFSLATPGNRWLRDGGDAEFGALFWDRDESVRGGTRLPSLVEREETRALNARLRAPASTTR